MTPVADVNTYSLISVEDVRYSKQYINFNFDLNYHNVLTNWLPEER